MKNIFLKISCIFILLLICCSLSIASVYGIYLYKNDSDFSYKIDQILNIKGERQYPDKDFEIVFKDNTKKLISLFDTATIYDLYIELDTTLNQINSNAYITYFNNEQEDLKEIYFRVYGNSSSFEEEMVDFSEIYVNGKPAVIITDASLCYIVLPEELKPGDSAVIEFKFQEKLVDETIGSDLLSQSFGMLESLSGEDAKSNYGLLGRINNVYNLNYFIPTIPNYDNGWNVEELTTSIGDIYNFDYAKWKVRFVSDQDMEIASTGEVIEENELETGKIEYKIISVSRDFAIEAGNTFDLVTKDFNGVRYNSFYSSSKENGELGLNYLADSLSEYEKIFSSYPYNEFDIVETPMKNGVGGLESTGMIMIGEFVYNLDSQESIQGLDLFSLFGDLNLGLEDTLEFTIAHEASHQWWHSIVGSDEVNYPWVDESLTNYSAVIYFEKKYGIEKRNEIIKSQLVGPYQQMKMLGINDAVVEQPVSSFSTLQYGGVVYGKGGLFYDKLRELVGDEVFFNSLKEYIEAFEYGHAESGDLVEIILKNSYKQDEIDKLYTRWIKEAHGDEDIETDNEISDIFSDLFENNEEFNKIFNSLLEGKEGQDELNNLFKNEN